MKIYQWTVFDKEYDDFQFFVGTSRLEVNKQAWKYYHDIATELIENGGLDSFFRADVYTNIVDFCKDKHPFLARNYCGSIEFSFNVFDVTECTVKAEEV